MRGSLNSHSALPLSILFLLSIVAGIPSADAEIGVGDGEGVLNLICVSDDECSLANVVSGEETIGRQENDPSPLNPELVILEFEMSPMQEQLALIPDELRILVVDLRITEDLLGWTQPDLDVELKIGPSENAWTIPGAGAGLQSQPEPYTLQDEELDLSEGRLIHSGDVVRLRLSFQLDRPANWELYLRGDSSIEMDIIWSVNPAYADVDEPSSQQQPKLTQEVEIWHDGALVGDDRDCWLMDLESHEMFNIIIIWDVVPIEVEQPHDAPDLVGPGSRNAPDPAMKTSYDGETLSVTFQYRGLSEGEHTLCWSGADDRFQSYSWMGRFTFEGLGPNSPGEFSGEATWDSEKTMLGDSERSEEIDEGGFITLAFGLMLLIGVIGTAAVQPNWNLTRRLMLPLSGLLVMFGGIVHPVMMWTEAIPEEGAMDIDELLQQRLEQIWQVNSPGTPVATMSEHIGSTFGILSGENLLLDIQIDSAAPLPDGRFQLHSPDLDGIGLDSLIFNHLNSVGAGHDSEGQLPQRSVNFVLLAGSALVLDLLMLETLLVVEEIPSMSILHIDWTMMRAGSSGNELNPVWATRPDTIELKDWSRIQYSLFPELMTISYCDCGMDQLDFTWVPSTVLDVEDVPTPQGLETPTGLGSTANWLMTLGILLILVTAVVETRRRSAARELAARFLSD